MLGWIINWTNIIWGSTLALAIFGAKKYSIMTEKEHTQLQEQLNKIRNYAPLSTTILCVWLGLRCLYAMGFLLVLEFLLVIGAVCYVRRREYLRETIQINQVHEMLQDTENLKAILGKELPEWLKNPGANRVQWINNMIRGMWGSIALAAEESVRQFVEPLLAANKPSFVYEFVLKQCSIGSRPMIIDGIQHQYYTETESLLDITVSWDSDMEIHLHLKVPGPDMHVYIRRFELNMKIRVILTPNVPKWPCFGTLVISIMDIWVLNFDITAAGVSLDAVPGLKGFLDGFIRDTLIGMLRYPKKIVVPIVQGYTLQTTRVDAALGTLRIHLLRVDDWHYRYASTKENTPFYVKLQLHSEKRKKRLRSTSYKGLNSALSDVFNFVLYDMGDVLHVWLYFDVLGNDTCVGECEIPVQILVDSKLPEHPCFLTKPSATESTARAKLIITPEFLSYTDRSRNGSTAAPSCVPTRKVSSVFLKERSSGDALIDPPSTRSSNNQSISISNTESGTLFVTVERCTGLKNMERLGTSDPYVVLRIRKQTRHSPYVSSCLEPVFNFEAELEVFDTKTDLLKVAIVDKNDLSKDRVMGTVSIPVSKVATSATDQISGAWNLDPQGKVYIRMHFLRH
ncbi:calcium-dependent lipid binding protein [Trypanosoma theileri]|uniref:Calcium-dependent lipid binding protein n=1 Tax=Trypanosoma theileri TaxID=67003 RepID=A0A1X0P711_9TRYP|nr:calcium-dependent lipid binding protein [Trypanosoma theileri]ORC92611.1 calcium-dependent lipid binding protein [Trypanosoma theileri]